MTFNLDISSAASNTSRTSASATTTNRATKIGGSRMPAILPASEVYFWSAKWQAEEQAFEDARGRGELHTYASADAAHGLTFRFSERFKKRLAKKTPEQQGAILRCIKKLEAHPDSPGLRVKKMQGYDNIWEARVDRGNRLTFERDGDVITLRTHCNHDILNSP
jgi:hypothetical protein